MTIFPNSSSHASVSSNSSFSTSNPPNQSTSQRTPSDASSTAANFFFQQRPSVTSVSLGKPIINGGPLTGGGGAGSAIEDEVVGTGIEGLNPAEALESILKNLAIENKIKDGAENMLQVLESSTTSSERSDLRKEVESELSAATKKITALTKQLDEIRDHPEIPRALRKQAQALDRSFTAHSHQHPQPPSLSSRRLPSNNTLNTSQTLASSHPNNSNCSSTNDPSSSSQNPLRSPSPEADFQTAIGRARDLLEQLGGDPGDDGESEMPNKIARRRIDAGNRLVDLLKKNVRVRYELGRGEEVMKVVCPLLSPPSPPPPVSTIAPSTSTFNSNPSPSFSPLAYRLLTHTLLAPQSWHTLLSSYGIHYHLIKTFTLPFANPTPSAEKVQAMRLIRKAVELGFEFGLASDDDEEWEDDGRRNGKGKGRAKGKGKARARTASGGGGSSKIHLSEPILRILISTAENPDDPFRSISLETLAELAILSPILLQSSNALRVLLQCFSEGPHELAPAVSTILLHAVDLPETRRGLRPGMDVEMALSGFTDVYGSGEAYLGRLRAASKVVGGMLRTWSGLLYLCMDDKQGILSIVECLRVPTIQMREVLLDMLFEVFRLKTPPWYTVFLDGKRLTMFGKNAKAHQPLRSGDVLEASSGTEEDPDKVTLVDHYVGFMLAVFAETGLIDALIDIIEENHNMLSRKATLLVGELLAMANKLLPSPLAARIQALPRLFAHASKFTDLLERNKASSALSSIDGLDRNRTRLLGLTASTSKEKRKRSNSVQDSLVRGQRQVESVKIRMGLQMDDKHFLVLLNDTQVLVTRDHTKWSFDILLEVVQGPLLNPRRLEEALRASKFGRRLLSFFHPMNHRFSDVKKTKPNQRYVQLGCAVLSTLLANPEGVAYLAADKLLPQLYECFAEIDHYHGAINSSPLLSKKRLDETLTSGYFEMLGTLSRHPEGVALLERFKFFTLFYHLSDLRSREDLIRAIIENLDYSTDGHPRIILSKALTSSYMHIRCYATQHLGHLVLSSTETNAWTLRLLITQLFDPSPEVTSMAVHFLEEACESPETLELVVQMRPFLDHLGEIGHPLLLRFLSTSVGFRYLYQIQYVDREMELWFYDRNHLYVVQVEVYLSRIFNPVSSDDAEDILVFDGTAPPHFYGELTKTEEGCQTLLEKGHFAEFAQFIRQHGLEASDWDLISKLKSVLWAVGNIGATKGGYPFLAQEDIIGNLVEIAEQSPVLSVRGTCFYVLGLVSSTQAGADFVGEFGWEATLNAQGEPTGLAFPSDISKFAYTCPCDSFESKRPPNQLIPPTSPLEQAVVTALSNLSNHVQANVSFRTLAKLKRQHRRLFTSVPLFFRALQALCTSHHRLPIRRLVFDLFDVSLTPTVISTLLKLEHTLRKPRPPSSPRSSRLSFSSSSSDGDDEGGGEDDDDDEDGKGRDNAASVRVSAAVPARLKRRSLGKAAEATAGRGAGSSSDEVEEKPVPPLLLPPRRRIEGFG